MVGMIVGEQQRIDPPHRHAELVEPDGGAASGIDQELLVAGLDQGARPEAIGPRNRRPRPEQRDAEIARGVIGAS